MFFCLICGFQLYCHLSRLLCGFLAQDVISSPSVSSFVESKLIQMAMVILCQKKMAMVIFKLLFLLK
jgi:hypothetical protein